MDRISNQIQNYLDNLLQYRLKIEGVPNLISYYSMNKFAFYYYATFKNNKQAYTYFDIMLEQAKRQNDYDIKFAQLELVTEEKDELVATWVF